MSRALRRRINRPCQIITPGVETGRDRRNQPIYAQVTVNTVCEVQQTMATDADGIEVVDAVLARDPLAR